MPQQVPSTSSVKGASAVTLSEEDVARLLQPDGNAEARVDISKKISSVYSSGKLDPKESIVAEQVFRLLVRDTELKVRAMLAEQLKSSKVLPRDIALSMAQDTADEVAIPILRYSEVLEDNDLKAALATNGASNRQVAISNRETVSREMSSLLLSHGHTEVVMALAKNEGAALSDNALGSVVDVYSGNEEMMNVLANRKGLPIEVAERVISHVSENVANSLRKKYKTDAKKVTVETEKGREESTLELLNHHTTPHEVEKLVEQLATFHRLTPTLIFSSLCQGHLLFFEYSLARLAGVPLKNAQTLLNDRGDLGFRALYNKSGLKPAHFSIVRLLLATVRKLREHQNVPAGRGFSNRLAEYLIQHSESEPIDNLPEIISLLRAEMPIPTSH